MTKEHTNKILKDFPKLYTNYYKGPEVSPMYFGFDCGDGWYQLVYNLSKRVDKLLKKESKAFQAGFTVDQVKQKFGGLRFYTSIHSDAIQKEIDKAETKSFETCEECGKPGKLRGTHWVQTVCNSCGVGTVIK